MERQKEDLSEQLKDLESEVQVLKQRITEAKKEMLDPCATHPTLAEAQATLHQLQQDSNCSQMRFTELAPLDEFVGQTTLPTDLANRSNIVKCLLTKIHKGQDVLACERAVRLLNTQTVATEEASKNTRKQIEEMKMKMKIACESLLNQVENEKNDRVCVNEEFGNLLNMELKQMKQNKGVKHTTASTQQRTLLLEKLVELRATLNTCIANNYAPVEGLLTSNAMSSVRIPLSENKKETDSSSTISARDAAEISGNVFTTQEEIRLHLGTVQTAFQVLELLNKTKNDSEISREKVELAEIDETRIYEAEMQSRVNRHVENSSIAVHMRKQEKLFVDTYETLKNQEIKQFEQLQHEVDKSFQAEMEPRIKEKQNELSGIQQSVARQQIQAAGATKALEECQRSVKLLMDEYATKKQTLYSNDQQAMQVLTQGARLLWPLRERLEYLLTETDVPLTCVLELVNQCVDALESDPAVLRKSGNYLEHLNDAIGKVIG